MTKIKILLIGNTNIKNIIPTLPLKLDHGPTWLQNFILQLRDIFFFSITWGNDCPIVNNM